MTKTTTARFISKYRELKIVHKSSFTKEVDGRIVYVPGTKIQFTNGAYETSNPEIIEFLEARPEFGKIIQRVPDDVSNFAAQKELSQTLEQREAELAKREAALEKAELKLAKDEPTAKDLRQQAKELGIPNYSKMNKAELQAAISSSLEEEPAY